MKYFREITPEILENLQNLSSVPQGTRAGNFVISEDVIFSRIETKWERIEVDADYEVSNLTTVVTICIEDYWKKERNIGEVLLALPIALASETDDNLISFFSALSESEVLSDELNSILTSKYGAKLQKLVDRATPTQVPVEAPVPAPTLTFLSAGETLDECEDGYFILNSDGKFVRYLTEAEEELI